jgi:hypothetical protein
MATAVSTTQPGDLVMPIVSKATEIIPGTDPSHLSFNTPSDFATSFQAPALDAKQGERFWILKLHFRVATRTGGAPEKALLTTSTDDLVTSSVAIATRHLGRRVQTSVGTTGLLGGSQRSVYDSDTVEFVHENYVRDKGVRHGGNRFTIAAVPVHGQPIVSIELLPDSNLTLSGVGPDEMRLAIPARSVTVRLGKQTTIPVELSLRGRRPDTSVRVSVGVLGSDVRLLSDRRTEYPSVGSGRVVRLRLRGDRIGEAQIVVRAVGAYNPASASITVRVIKPSSLRRNTLLVLAGLLCLLTAVAFWRRREA